MTIQIKRAYDAPLSRDGFRILVDRLWPRGVAKASAKIDLWAKEVAPSNELRAWFHENKEERFKDFSKCYAAELAKGEELKDLKRLIKDKKNVTLITAAKDVEHSHILTLMRELGR